MNPDEVALQPVVLDEGLRQLVVLPRGLVVRQRLLGPAAGVAARVLDWSGKRIDFLTGGAGFVVVIRTAL